MQEKESLHQSFRDINKSLIIVATEIIIFCLLFSGLLIYQTIKILQSFEEFNKELDLKVQEINQSFDELNKVTK